MAIDRIPPSLNNIPPTQEPAQDEPATTVVRGESLTRPGQHFVLRYLVDPKQSTYVSGRPHTTAPGALADLLSGRRRPS